TTIRLQYLDTFTAGETITIDQVETLILVSSSDRLTWSVTRSNPKAHAVNTIVLRRKFTSWSELVASNVLTLPGKWPPTGWSNDTLFDTDLTYAGYHRAALAQAVRAKLSVPGLAESFA